MATPTHSDVRIPATQTRNTRQKDAIRRAFEEAARPLSPEEVLATAQQSVDGLSQATVYRNLGTLVEDGWLTTVDVPGSAPRYEIAGKGHHHHFHCTRCGRIYDLNGCSLKVTPELPEGFRMTGHEFFLYGLCAACV